MELKIDNFIRISGHDQYLIMKERLESCNETYTVLDISKEGSNNEDYYFLILDNKKEKHLMKSRVGGMPYIHMLKMTFLKPTQNST